MLHIERNMCTGIGYAVGYPPRPVDENSFEYLNLVCISSF